MTVTQIEQPADDQWRAISKELMAVARRRAASPQDAEDRTQDAILKLVRDDPDSPGVPSLPFAHQALKIVAFDEWRGKTRKLEVPEAVKVSLDDPLRNGAALAIPTDDDVADRLLFLEMVEDVRSIVGDEAVEMLTKMAAGWTEAEIEDERAPGAPSTGALRKRVFRAMPRLTARLNRF
jgi:DNA-directed RNA polymerase specialized sigma24 family protein